MEKLKLEVDIIKTKVLIFLAIAGGSWVYGEKYIDILYGKILFVGFIIGSVGVLKNLMLLSDIQKRLKEK